MGEELSNKTLAVIVVAAIVVTLGSTALIMGSNAMVTEELQSVKGMLESLPNGEDPFGEHASVSGMLIEMKVLNIDCEYTKEHENDPTVSFPDETITLCKDMFPELWTLEPCACCGNFCQGLDCDWENRYWIDKEHCKPDNNRVN